MLAFSGLRSRRVGDLTRSGFIDRVQFPRLRRPIGVIILTARNGRFSALTAVAVRDTGLTDRVRKTPPTAWALAVEAFGQCRKRRRLRNCHNRLERQRSAMGVVTVGDSSYGMAKDFDG